MKINKILAAGIAATLAVTSLSAVASAETKSLEWKMDYTFSKVQWNNQKIAYLDDNSYIKGGDSAAGTAKAIIGAELTTGANVVALFGAAGAGVDPYKGTKNFITDTAGTNAADAAVKLDADASLTADMTKYNKAIKDALASILVSDAAAIVNAGKLESEYSAAKLVGDAQYISAQLLTAIDNVNALITSVNASTDANKDAIKTYLTDTTKAGLTAAKTELDKQIALAQAALEGDPLLADDEIGGIALSTLPVKATNLVAFRNWWEEVPGGFTNPDKKGNAGYYVQLSGAKVEIKGTKRGSTASETVTKDFTQGYTDYDGNHYGTNKDKTHIFVAFAPKYVNRDGFINLNVFGTITDVNITASFKIVKLKDGKTEANNDHLNPDNFEDVCVFQEVDYKLYEGVTIKSLAEQFKKFVSYFEAASDPDAFNPATTAANLKTYDQLQNTNRNLYKLYTGLKNSAPTGTTHDNSNSKKTLKPFLKMTTDTNGATIVRNKVLPLSYTRDYESLTINSKVDGSTQTYDDAGMGTQPKWFAGLASQTADFFHKQNNGQIIFKFMDPAQADLWVSYGVPSTEVGLRTLQGTAMALFFNYATSTGSIQSIGVVDKDAWTITFDMATVLDDFGNHTKGSLEDIYYGLNEGLKYGSDYDNATGYVVEKVILQYDDSPAAVDATTDDDAAVVVADDDDDVVADDDDDDIFADDDVVADDDDDDDDAGIIEDDDDDDTDVNNDVDYVDGADDDANPGTGVGLAVIPAIVAAAAAIVSKKRK